MGDNVDLLLVGRTGNGKSSTGNSILGTKAFVPRSSSSSVTDDMSKSSAEIGGKLVTVVDGPGLGDTGFDVPADVNSAIDMARKALHFFVTGFHALLIVLKYGVRFTKQEKDAIQMIKSVYGEDVVKNHGVIVMTHGDSYDLDMEDEGTPFESWCKQQGGDVQTLFKECGQRCVLFNNRTKDNGRMREQYNKLMANVESIRSRRKPYTKEDFRRAEPSRIKMIVMAKLPQLRKETDDFVDKIEQRARQIEDQPHLKTQGRLDQLEGLKAELDEYKAELGREDHGTGSVSQILLQLSVTESSIRSKIDRYRRAIDEAIYRSDIRRSNENLRYKHGGFDGGDQSKGEKVDLRKVLNNPVVRIVSVLLVICLLYLLVSYYLLSSEQNNAGTPAPSLDTKNDGKATRAPFIDTKNDGEATRAPFTDTKNDGEATRQQDFKRVAGQ